MRSLRAAAVQFNHEPGDKTANMQTVRRFAAKAAQQDVDLVVFPEMCITGYWHIRNLAREAIEALAEPVPSGASTQELRSLAEEHQMTVGAGLIERGSGGALYNTFVVAMSDGRTVRHRKLHCFLSEHMSSGNSYTVFDDPDGNRLGVLTCYDNNIVENARITALKGAEILLAPHQTGGCDSSSPRAMGLIDPELWYNRHENPEAIEAEFRGPKGRGWLMRWLPSRAHDNGMFLIFANGVGYDDGEVRTGNAMIIDTYGEIIDETWHAGDDMVVADLDPTELPSSSGRRWLKARRPDLYGPITKPVGDEQDTRTVRFTKVSDESTE